VTLSSLGTEHKNDTEQVRETSTQQQASSSNSMSQSMKGMMHGISEKSGDDFDKAFISEMIVHHQGAVEMAKDALIKAKHQEIKDLAKNIIEAQEKEINTMNNWASLWYGVK
jgi:uncharacterized protein (DUF305 family)